MTLAEMLRDRGGSIVFAGFGPRPTAGQRAEAERIGTLHWLDGGLDWLVADEAELDAVGPVLDDLADREAVDVLHLNLPSQAARLKTARPVVVVTHSCVPTWWATVREGPLPEAWIWQMRRNAEGFARADAIIAPSNSHAELTEACYGPQPKLTVVPNGVRSVPRGDLKEDFVFGAARWWDEGKNLQVIDRAAARLKWETRLAGETAGPHGGQVTIEHARGLGPLPHTEVLDLAQRAAIAVSPSIYEPFGLVALECARACTPLVLADIPTYRELWGGAALFFAPHDASELARVIGRLIGDPALREEMGACANARSRSFSLQAQADAMAAVHARIAGPAARLPTPES
ncbi:glycosyltransferase family 4 protein [Methylobrevis pamukkalensis]|uniref:Glycogen synthase n=1 Tax=Methylobrevis pamukkalensis TaxID=1439726 RepID=A0A1E3H1E1_9HYPH|nr:Glycogen synthase [Methylobrevis pamukkalensis]